MAFCPICGRNHGPEEACFVPPKPAGSGDPFAPRRSRREAECSADQVMLPLLLVLAAVAIAVVVIVMLRI